MISYKKLQKLLIDKDIKKTQLKDMIKVSSSTLARLSTNQYVSLEIIDKICDVLDCQPGDIIEYVSSNNWLEYKVQEIDQQILALQTEKENCIQRLKNNKD